MGSKKKKKNLNSDELVIGGNQLLATFSHFVKEAEESCFSIPCRAFPVHFVHQHATWKVRTRENNHKKMKTKVKVKPVQSAVAAINFNKYPIKFVDRQLMNLGEKWIT